MSDSTNWATNKGGVTPLLRWPPPMPPPRGPLRETIEHYWEFPPDLDWFEEFKLWVDLGYFGIETDYEALEINIPHKKPRKSKANPKPELTAEQKEENKCINQVRGLVEHAIGGMKRFNILIAKSRNHKENFVDDVALLAAGLWNWKLVVKGVV